MTPDQVAELLREAHPDADPSDVEPLVLDVWLERLGVDGTDGGFVAKTLIAWDRLIV